MTKRFQSSEAVGIWGIYNRRRFDKDDVIEIAVLELLVPAVNGRWGENGDVAAVMKDEQRSYTARFIRRLSQQK